MNQIVRNNIFQVSCLLVLAGVVMHIIHLTLAPHILAFGAAGITLCYMTAPYKDLDFRRRRLHRINILSGISMIAASVFMFRERNEWAVFLFISAILILYTSFISPRGER